MAEYLVTSTRLIEHMLMKRIIGLIMVVMLALTAASCYSHRHHPHGMPPGQAKKIYGKKSAKHFAPGQQKKKYKGKKGNNGNRGNNGRHHHTSVHWYN